MEQTIKTIIKRKVDDNLLNHIKTVIFLHEDIFEGTFKNDEFRIWKYSKLTGAFYPVIIGKIIKDGSIQKIQIRTKMNSFGRLIQCFIFFILSFGLIESGIISTNFKSFDLLISIGGLLLIFLFMAVILLSYRDLKKDLITEFKKLFNDNGCL